MENLGFVLVCIASIAGLVILAAMLEKFVTFDTQDVLFLYSTSVLNNSSTLK